MRLLIFAFFVLCTFCVKAADVVPAQLTNDIGDTRYICPDNYELKGTECHHVECQYEQLPELPPLLAPMCDEGYVLVGNRCERMSTEVVCPQGTRMENRECVFRVPSVPTVYVDFVCPENTVKDVRNRKCILTPQVTEMVVQCPIGFQRIGNTCYYQKTDGLSIVCPDGTKPIDNYCTLSIPEGKLRVICPPGSFLTGKNICEFNPVNAQSRCPDGSLPDFMNTCRVQLTGNFTITRDCPPGAIERNGKCIYKPIYRYPMPEIEYLCPNNFERMGDLCVMSLKATYQQAIQCPDGFFREGDACVQNLPSKMYNVTVNCPPNTRQIPGRGCEAIYNGDLGSCEITKNSPKCCGKKKCRGKLINSNLKIHNINHINSPTNITSSNIFRINIGGFEENQFQQNKTNVNVTQIVKPEKIEPCCTIVTPRICDNNNGEWECGHREYKRCGRMCTQDVIHLKASRPMYRQQMLVMPPPQYGMKMQWQQHGGQVNCGGCTSGRYSCSPECFQYDCADDGCNFIDQNSFCSSYGGEGCAFEDGYSY